MTDTHDLLKDELKVYYPDVTDAELTEMTNRLVNVFTIGAKAIYKIEKAKFSLNDIDVTNSE